MRRIGMVTYVGFGLFFVGLISAAFLENKVIALSTAIPGFALVGAASLSGRFMLRCKHCGSTLAALLLCQNHFRQRVDPRIRYCPYCGVSLDEYEEGGDSP
jgi:hypothetical protein